jgi:hypothetical protein
MRLLPTLAAALGVLLLSGCGATEVDIGKLEQDISSGVQEQSDVRVEVACPDQVDWEKGGSFECDVTDEEGRTKTAKVTMLDEDGQVDWRIE